MSLFSTILRPGARPGIPSDGFPGDSASLLPWHAFDAAIERSLHMLRGVHIPVSFFAVYLGTGGRGDAAEVVGEALSQFGPVGWLADGSVGLLYLGPRPPEKDGDTVLTSRIFNRVERRLQERGWAALCRGLELAAVHGWTDEIDGSADLVQALDQHRAGDRPAKEARRASRGR